jgi:hypothetical protein
LNVDELRCRKFSQSLALLTQHLFNGEIVNNGQSNEHGFSQNIFESLEDRSLNSVNSPVKQGLTFIKSCRLTEVKFVNKGLQTSGHLWKLGKKIKVKCEAKLPGEDSTRDGLNGHQRYCLKQLAHELGTGVHGRRYETLADNLLRYLAREKRSKHSFADKYMRWMAKDVFGAMIDQGKVLRLGCLVGSSSKGSAYCGIFVCEAKDQAPEYIFTASSPSKRILGDLHKHVSLEVEVLNPNSKGLPELITGKWVNGFYFTSGEKKRNVLFPWLDALKF